MKTKKHFVFLICILFLSVGCTTDDAENSEKTDDATTADYDIYSLILKEQFSDLEYYVISEETTEYTPNPFEEGFYGNREALKELDSSTIENFIAANDSVYNLDEKFDVAPKNVQMISKSEFDEIFTTEGIISGWETFYTKYPDSGGYINFGSVGYDKTENEAIVEVSHIYGSLGADGFMIVLEKKNGNWVIRQAVHLWIS